MTTSRSLSPLRFLQLAATSLASLWMIGCASVKPSDSPRPSRNEDTLRMQIFLDSKGFGPGVVDGKGGEFTRKALVHYRAAQGLTENDLPDVSGISPYTTYTVTAKDLSILGTMASEPADLAKQEKLPYTTLIECLSERFHTTQTFLRQLNPGMDINSLNPGASIAVPNIRRPFRFDSFPSAYAAPSASTAQARQVIVDLSYRTLQVQENGRTIAAFPITPGSTEHPAPAGEWRVVGAVPWPWYRYDEGVLKRGVRTESFHNLPPGPNSPVGIMWAGLNRSGVGIHGTSVPDTIGRAGSHGCIRLSNWDAAIFHTLIGKGTKVIIR